MERRFARVWFGGVRIVALLEQELAEPMMGEERGIEQWAFSDRRQCLTLCHQIFDGREITVIDTRSHQTGPIHDATLRDVVDDEISPTLANPIEHPRCVLCHDLDSAAVTSDRRPMIRMPTRPRLTPILIVADRTLCRGQRPER
jgi:hypothetical protein